MRERIEGRVLPESHPRYISIKRIVPSARYRVGFDMARLILLLYGLNCVKPLKIALDLTLIHLALLHCPYIVI